MFRKRFRPTSTVSEQPVACWHRLTSLPPPAVCTQEWGGQRLDEGSRWPWGGKGEYNASEGVLDKGVVTVSPPSNKQATLTLICLFYPSTHFFVPSSPPRPFPFTSRAVPFTCPTRGPGRNAPGCVL